MNPGLYLSHVPGLGKLDLRAEGVYTDLPGLRGVGFLYYNFHYKSGYTNEGRLIGDWIGRQGSGFTLRSTYWIQPTKKIEMGYRDRSTSSQFIQGGGEVHDVFGRAEWDLSRRVSLFADVQYETWRFPLLSAKKETNVSTSFELRYRPKLRLLNK
jgi:hypothetical protein